VPHVEAGDANQEFATVSALAAGHIVQIRQGFCFLEVIMAKARHRRAPHFVSFPRSGKLPPALLNPDSAIAQRAFGAVDNIETGIRNNDPQAIRTAQREVSKAVSCIRRDLCTTFRYPDPDPANPQVWQVLCTSGKDGEFLASPLDCANCHLFNTSFRTTPSALPVRTIAEVLAMEAQHV